MPRPESRANFCGRRPTTRGSHPVKARVCAISCPSLPSPCKNTLSWDESSLAAEWRAPQPRVRQRSPPPCRSLSAPGADFLPAAPNIRQTHRPARQCPVWCGVGQCVAKARPAGRTGTTSGIDLAYYSLAHQTGRAFFDHANKFMPIAPRYG